MIRSSLALSGRLPLIVAIVLLVSSTCWAQTFPPGFGGFKHVRAAADDGAPDGLLRIAQTPDGYIWLAGDALYRFDGATFERIDWPDGATRRHASPSALMVSRKGELWVGMRDTGGAAVYRKGSLRDLHMTDPPRGLSAFAETPDGATWASSMGLDKRLQRMRGTKWEQVDEALALPPGYIMDLIVGRGGRLWVALSAQDGESGTLAFLDPHTLRFQVEPVRLSGRPKIALDRTGALWASDATGTRMLFDARGVRTSSGPSFPAVPGVTRASLAFDRDGGLWGTTGSVGIFYVADPRAPRGTADASVKRFGAANGLTSDTTYGAFVDREGSVWITTEGGLDQFRRAAAEQQASIPPDAEQGLSIARAQDRSVYIGSRSTIFHIAANGLAMPALRLRTDAFSMCPAREGGVWIVQPGRTVHLDEGRTRVLPAYPGGTAMIACAEDAAGRLWLGLADGALLWRDRAGWHRAGGTLAPRGLWDLTTTTAGDLAMIDPPDIVVLHGSRPERIALAPTGIGTPWAVIPGSAPGSHDLFVSGSEGLVRIRGNQLRRLEEKRFPWITWVRTLQQTQDGRTWLFSRSGVYRVATADLDRAFSDARAPLPYTKYDALDGLASTVQQGGFAGQQSVVAADGKLWFLNRQRAAFFDPATLQPNRIPPPVVIRSLAAGHRTWRDPADLVLPGGTRTVNLGYAGLSFTMPQRVHFRYRLDGVDDGWIDAGVRRTASYSNLGPGHYRFHVIARNSDGIWNRRGATLAFEIRPTFLQSWPVKLLFALVLLGLAWLTYSMRLRTVANRVRMRMNERADERERIARELHDTLLQSVQALTLRFQLAADDLPAGTPGRTSLVTAIDTADQVIAEGRDRVRALRSQQEGDLEQIISDLVARLEFGPELSMSITSSGGKRAVDPTALDEIARIAGEALFNIRRHADASEGVVDIHHGTNLQMRIFDNGRGIDPDVAAAGQRDGHYGLVGMAERARRLRGQVEIQPVRPSGTEVMLTVPGSIAYKVRARRPWSS